MAPTFCKSRLLIKALTWFGQGLMGKEWWKISRQYPEYRKWILGHIWRSCWLVFSYILGIRRVLILTVFWFHMTVSRSFRPSCGEVTPPHHCGPRHCWNPSQLPVSEGQAGDEELIQESHHLTVSPVGLPAPHQECQNLFCCFQFKTVPSPREVLVT